MQHFRIQCASVFIVRNHDGAFVRRRFPHADEPADYLQPHIRNTVGTVAHKGHWKKNIISFVRFYEFLRINISYVRLYEILFFLYEIYISYKINTNSYEQNSISISFVRNIISFVRMNISFVRNINSHKQNNISYEPNIFSLNVPYGPP